MSTTTDHNDKALLRGIGAGLAAGTALGLAAGVVAVSMFWPEGDLGSGLEYLGNMLVAVLVRVSIGGAIGLVVGTSLAWHGGTIGATLDRGDAAPIYGVLTGLVLGTSFGPIVGGALGLGIDQLLGGAVLGLALGPIVGVIGWETAYWTADMARGAHHEH